MNDGSLYEGLEDRVGVGAASPWATLPFMRTRDVAEKLPRMRGEVVGALADLERVIDGIFCGYYADDAIVDGVAFTRADAFISDLLSDDLFSFGLRCNTLERILRREKWLDKSAGKGLDEIRRAGRLRNIFAHVNRGFYATGEFYLTHPRKTAIDPTKMYEEFLEAHKEATTFLKDIRHRLVAKYPDRKILFHTWSSLLER